MKFLIQPIEMFFNFIYQYVSAIFSNPGTAYGLTIIILTLIIRLLVFPLNYKSTKSMLKTAEIGPKMKQIQDKYKNNPQKANEEVMKLYKEEGVNPMSGCLPMLIQLPILYALFGVFNDLQGIQGASFLWLKDLAKPDALYILPILSGVTTYLISKVTPTAAVSADNAMQNQQKTMNIMMTVMMVVMTIPIKSALALYWVAGNLIQLVQNLVMIVLFKKKKNS